MNARPSDSAIAQAFREFGDIPNNVYPHSSRLAWRWMDARSREIDAARPEQVRADGPEEMSPDFTDSARAALAWVLFHHQGGSSPVGQPIRFALGMGAHEQLPEWRVAEAKRWAERTRSKTSDFHEQIRPAPAERADDVEALIVQLQEMAVPQPFGTVMYVELDEAAALLRRLAAKPQAMEAVPNDDDGIEAVKRHGIFFYEVDFGDEGKGRYIRLRDFNRIVEKLETKPQADQDRKDAERYRFIRNPVNAIVYAKDISNWNCVPYSPTNGSYGHFRYEKPEQLDAAIDAAKAQEAGNG